jgi:hypothetical protein
MIAQLTSMTSAEQWNWVLMAYGIAYFALVAFASSIAIRITRARRRLEESS